MWKQFKKYWSIALNFVLAVALFFSFSFTDEELVVIDTSGFSQRDLSRSLHIKPNMPVEDLIDLMGPPVVKEIRNDLEIFHYCNTETFFDSYISIETTKNKVNSMTYSVAGMDDVAFSYTSTPSIEFIETIKPWDCKHGLKWRIFPVAEKLKGR